MENWQKYVNEVAEQEGIETDNVIFLFEQSQITTCDFNVLLERLDNKTITLEQFYNMWEKSLLHEAKILADLEEGLLDWGKEKIAQLTDKGKQAWVTKISQLIKKGTAFVLKSLKQVIAFAKKLFSTMKSTYNEATAKGYLGGLNLIRNLMRAAMRVGKFIGPFVIVAGCVLVFSIAFAGTAHAAASGIPVDPDLWAAAAEIISEGLTMMGGVEALEPDVTNSLQSIVSVDGEVIQIINQFEMQESFSAANREVDALEVLVNAIRRKIGGGGDPATLEELMEYMPEADAAVKENIKLALEEAQLLKETDPEMYQEYVKAGKELDIGWSGQVKSELTRYASASRRTDVSVNPFASPEERVRTAHTIRQTATTAGIDHPIRTTK